ncbi:MAG: hypothetical protein LW832_10240, partial [Parachlamydia sp.]|nr:hypothetical protein [Parachlamydia sp.]
IAACVGKIDVEVVKKAMVKIRTKDVDEWTREQMGETLLSKRRKSLGEWRKRKKPKKVARKLTGIHLGEAMGF